MYISWLANYDNYIAHIYLKEILAYLFFNINVLFFYSKPYQKYTLFLCQ